MDFVAFLSGPDNVGAIERFYAAHPHPHVAVRAEKLCESAGCGDFTIVRRGDEIVGCNGIFSHRDAIGQTLIELGQSRVTLGGYDLYRSMVYVCVLKAFVDHQKVDFLFGQVDESNPFAIERALEMGYERFRPSDNLVAVATGALPEDKRADTLGVETVYLQFPRGNLHLAQIYIAERLNNDRLAVAGTRGIAEVHLKPGAQGVIEKGLAL